MVSTLLSVIILQVNLFHTPLLRVLELHIKSIRGISIHITEPKIHISCSENHDSTLFFNYFYMSSLPTLVHTIAKGSTFSISSPFDVTKLQKIVFMSHRQAAFRSRQWTRIFLTTPIAMGTQLCFIQHPESHSSSRKL